MISTTNQETASQQLIGSNPQVKKHTQLIAKTYQNNTDSDYTEKMETLGKNFDYQTNSHAYWGEPEFSTLYGTPLYEEASESQKLALNHLYWIGQYSHTANSEANTILYNRVTAGVFANIPGYEKLCDELNFETDQEHYHIKTFQRIGYKTKIALQGKASLKTSFAKKGGLASSNWTEKLIPPKLRSVASPQTVESILRSTTRLMHGRDQDRYYSCYLAQNESIPTTIGGIIGYTAPPSAFKFLTLNWGSSPFMACQYYCMRMIANMSLKAYEHQYFKRYRELDKRGEFVPVPTAVSYFHMLDESFHTTMSQTIAQEVYKDFAPPTAYEKLLSNLILIRAQSGILGGLSGWLPATFRSDETFIASLYKLLQSPVFGMSQDEALQWIEKCLCQEHQGFHSNLKHHQSLLSDFQRFFGRIDYLWAVNREMKIMAAGGNIAKAIANNSRAFEKFSKSLAADSNLKLI